MKRLMMATALMTLLLGCGERADEKVFVIVNGQPIREGDVKSQVLVLAKMHEIAGDPIDPAKFGKWANRAAMAMVAPMMNQILLQDAAARNQVTVEEEDIARTLASFNRQLRLEKKTRNELGEVFGELKQAFLRRFDGAALIEAYTRSYWQINVDDAMVDQYYQFKTNELLNAARIDERARKQAKAAYSRLQAGESWDEVAKVSEDRQIRPMNEKNASDWLWTGKEALGIPQLALRLPTMSVGDYTEPIEADEGMMIVRLNERRQGLFHLSRILFRMAMPVSVQKPDKVREYLCGQVLSQFQTSTISQLIKDATCEYPMGSNFVYQIWKEKAAE